MSESKRKTELRSPPLSVRGDHIHSGRTDSVLPRMQKLHGLTDEDEEKKKEKREKREKKTMTGWRSPGSVIGIKANGHGSVMRFEA